MCYCDLELTLYFVFWPLLLSVTLILAYQVLLLRSGDMMTKKHESIRRLDSLPTGKQFSLIILINLFRGQNHKSI